MAISAIGTTCRSGSTDDLVCGTAGSPAVTEAAWSLVALDYRSWVRDQILKVCLVRTRHVPAHRWQLRLGTPKVVFQIAVALAHTIMSLTDLQVLEQGLHMEEHAW